MNSDLEIQSYLNHLQKSNNLNRLATNYDNTKEPIHRWFPFLAGFSHKLVGETFSFFSLNSNEKLVFDPFMGSGTTGVVGKELGVKVVGNESNQLLHRICNLKTSLVSEPETAYTCGLKLLDKAEKVWKNTDVDDENKLLKKCYSRENLKKLVTLRDIIKEYNFTSEEHKDYVFMAITMALPKSSNVGINVPYVSWRNERKPREVFTLFKENLELIKDDLSEALSNYKNNSKTKVFLHDSRKKNKRILSHSVDAIFTSPPYLNNFDYGESLKVYLYFWKLTNDWSEITKKIRFKSMASATTYYKEYKYSNKEPEKILGGMSKKLPNTSHEILNRMKLISQKKLEKKSSKSFDILTGLYFRDMSKVMEEMYRVSTSDSLAFIVIGDSAPFGIHVPTDTLIGEMSIELGFSSYTLQPLRERGTKWKSLKYRHNRKLRESLVILRK